MAETYRKTKIEHFIARLDVRMNTWKAQLDKAEFHDLQQFIQGQIAATDLIQKELLAEFDLLAEKEE